MCWIWPSLIEASSLLFTCAAVFLVLYLISVKCLRKRKLFLWQLLPKRVRRRMTLLWTLGLAPLMPWRPTAAVSCVCMTRGRSGPGLSSALEEPACYPVAHTNVYTHQTSCPWWAHVFIHFGLKSSWAGGVRIAVAFQAVSFGAVLSAALSPRAFLHSCSLVLIRIYLLLNFIFVFV